MQFVQKLVAGTVTTAGVTTLLATEKVMNFYYKFGNGSGQTGILLPCLPL